MGNVRDDPKFVLYKRPPLFLFCGVLILVAYISSYVFELEPQAFIPNAQYEYNTIDRRKRVKGKSSERLGGRSGMWVNRGQRLRSGEVGKVKSEQREEIVGSDYGESCPTLTGEELVTRQKTSRRWYTYT